ncbi:hypothetical protein ACHAXA_003139, partial [Cyclostephanos tholiformis]
RSSEKSTAKKEASSSSSASSIPAASVLVDIKATTAIASLESSQTLTVAKIALSIPDLALKPDACYDLSSSDLVIGSSTIKLRAFDAPGPANAAWLSDLCVDSRLSSLTIYIGPLTNVPHLISRCSMTTGGGGGGATDNLSLFIDFRLRSYGAYEMRNPISGEYPGPDTLGRKSFKYLGARRDYETKFGTADVSNFLSDVRSSLTGAVDNPGLGNPALSELETLTRGPLALDVTMPLSADNVNTIISARERAVDISLGWALDTAHRHKPGAPVNGQYVYNSKYKINAYLALLNVYVKLFGQKDGKKLAAADSGPIDEANVGGGS